ncbi:hypothetical protein AACH06_30020 [Ideonella sp. DXS29W]|uniref:Uncharacterized protein n=1 Tax=Ideonella lacteola TaxID=2984193 RepID=A0ABU9C2I9_9BURK
MTRGIVQVGTWKYDGSVERPVDIIALEVDWWYELARVEGQLDSDERPMPLGPQGCLYYARFKHAGTAIEPTFVDTPGFQTLEEAKSAAQRKVDSLIQWKEQSKSSVEGS